MAIGPIGNAIYVNQQTASVASEVGSNMNRADVQQVAAQTIMQERLKELQETRPAEEMAEVDPDREHQQQNAEENEEEAEKQKEMAAESLEEAEKNKDEEPKPLKHLDITA